MHGLIQARRLGWLLLAALTVSLVMLVAGMIAADRAHDRAAARAQITAALRAGLLASEISRFRLLPLTLSDDRDVVAAVAGSAAARDMLDRKLERLNGETGAAAIYVLDRAGKAIAASNWRTPRSFVGQDYRFRAYYRGAVAHGRAMQFALGTVSQRPGLYISQRGPSGGIVVVKQEFGAIEADWRAGGGATFVQDGGGTILLTSRPVWRFTVASRIVRGGMLASAVPVRGPDWRLTLLLPVAGEIDAAVALARTLALLASLVVIAAGWALRERARRRAERAAAAAARTAGLEAMVAERTADLRREMAERAELEARAADLRESLRQANRLASLGQITAGIAHETAQPVAAIRSYAANGRRLIERGDTGAADGNFAAIERLTERIGAVTASLRGFARKATGVVAPMPLADAFTGVRLILRDRLAPITVAWPVLPPGLLVLAEPVRLEQVLVNLLQNAAEALDGQAAPHIAIDVTQGAGLVLLRVADNGPGIDPAVAARLFTPFVTSRPAGLGLGLVISSDIMVDLGGHLRLIESPAGACFELGLREAAA